MPFLAPLIVPILIKAGVSTLVASLIGAGFSAVVGLIQASKKPKGQERAASVTTLGLGEGPREAVFGKQTVGGQLVYAFNYGAKNLYEAMCIKLCDHEIEAYEGFYIGEVYYAFEGNGAQSSFTISGQPNLWMYVQMGTQTQTVPSAILAESGTRWTADDTMQGCAHVWVVYRYDDKVWPGGRPQFKHFIGGLKCYDPRYSIDEGGTQDFDDPSTWVYSENPVVWALNYKIGTYNNGQLMVGRGFSLARAMGDFDSFATEANICDEGVALKAGGSQQRYTSGGLLVQSTDEYIEVLARFTSATGGILVSRSGRLEIQTGYARAVTAEFTDSDLVFAESIEFSAFLQEPDRVNTVIPQFRDEYQYWAYPVSAPMRRDFADVTADGRPFELQLELECTTDYIRAQRIGEIARRKGRLERTVTLTLPPRFANVEVGDWVEWTSDRYFAGATVAFQVIRDDDDISLKKRLTMREISEDCFDWVAADDELDRGEALNDPGTAADIEITGLAATAVTVGGLPAIKIEFDPVTDPAIQSATVLVREDGGTDISPTVIDDPAALAAGVAYVTNGVGAALAMEVAVQPKSADLSRVAVTSSFAAVTTSALAGGAGAVIQIGAPTRVGPVTVSGTSWQTIATYAETGIPAGAAVNLLGSEAFSTASTGSNTPTNEMDVEVRITEEPTSGGTVVDLVTFTGTVTYGGPSPGDTVMAIDKIALSLVDLTYSGNVTYKLQIRRTAGMTSVDNIRGILTGQLVT